MFLLVPAVIGIAFAIVVWMAISLLTCSASGLVLRLCIGSLGKKPEFEGVFPKFASRSSIVGISAMAAGIIGIILHVIYFITPGSSKLFIVLSQCFCTLLCIACGVLLLCLASKLKKAGGGTLFVKRRIISIVLGTITLLASLSCIGLSAYIIYAFFAY